MSNLVKNKKGVEGAGFGLIVGIIIILVSGGVILWVVLTQAPKAEEKSPMELCLVSNQIKVGIEHATSEYATTTRVCETIDKTEGKYIVPTSTYTQDEAGAVKEVRDMIKECWRVWLKGEEPNMFRLFPGQKTCHICYRFRVKDDLKKVEPEKPFLVNLAEAMNGPYSASIPKDNNCDPPNGGKWVNIPPDVDWKNACPGSTAVKKDSSTNQVCCRKDVRFECENKGGICCVYKDGKRICDAEDIPSGESSTDYPFEYDEWNCPVTGYTCHVKSENGISYMQYISESSALGGDFYLFDPNQNIDGSLEDINYAEDTIYAISFTSPAKQCEGMVCEITNFFISSLTPRDTLYFIQFLPGGRWSETVSRHAVEKTTPFLEDVPNSIMLSTFEEAQELGCKME